MSAGRNCWIAAWAFAALMAIPCGEAVAASVTVPADPDSWRLDTGADHARHPGTAACAVEPAPTGGSGDRRTRELPAPPSSDPAPRAASVRLARIPVEPAARTYGRGHASAASARQGVPMDRGLGELGGSSEVAPRVPAPLGGSRSLGNPNSTGWARSSTRSHLLPASDFPAGRPRRR